MANPIDYWYQKYLALKAKMDEMREAWLKDRDGCFWDGVNEGKKAMKEQMMKEARNHFVLRVLSDNTTKKMIELYNDEVDCKFGDVVRIIIVKEEKNGTE